MGVVSNMLHEKLWELILRKIIEIVTTTCQILRLKRTKIRFRLGKLLALPQAPQPDLRDLLLRGWEGKGNREVRGVARGGKKK